MMAAATTLRVPGGQTGGQSGGQPGGSAEMSHEERVLAFKSDPQLMEAASRFVADVLEKAKEEAASRAKNNSKVERPDADSAGSRRLKRGGPWHSRARGFVARLFAAICGCNSATDVKA
ncbi:uncharacterized protein LOC132198815 isoform X2 [Neocloeon triangulifer]|uniref:uncharacterized protein LOC132198815 isoform X2 n=1 Tax=Neocloeon triangulifer TaxID=2078957 RepID=UPI00286FA81F|nr:uncharacterized protein LOC132198815 isoform X2 [Neocloeon triangulifer]